MHISDEVRGRCEGWDTLLRWQRRELGRELRALGLSYGEIRQLIPVPQGTLSAWCKHVELSNKDRARIKALTHAPGSEARRRSGETKRRTHRRRANEVRAHAKAQAPELSADPLWVAGVVAYWSEGSKRSNDIRFANSDPDLVRLFINWCERYLDRALHDMRCTLHLHAGQDEAAEIAYWAAVTRIHPERFGKTFIKPPGTGHRKRVLYHGVATIRVARSSEALHRVFGWIEGIGEIATR